MASTFAGISNISFNGPVLEFDATQGSNSETLAPIAQVVNLGRITGSDLASLAADDNNAQTLCKFFVPNLASPFINTQMTYSTTISNPTSLGANVKARWMNAGAYRIRILQFNYQLNADVETLQETNLSGAFSVFSGTAAGALADFVSGGQTKVRVQVRQVGPSTALLPCAPIDRSSLG